MSYAMLGNRCCSSSVACTSNHKFLPLYSGVYDERINYMMRYPCATAREEAVLVPQDSYNHPEMIKNYYGKLYKSEDRHVKVIKNPAAKKTCSTC